MARVIEERRPDTVVVHDREHEPANTGLIIATIAIILFLLLIFFASRMFGGGSGANINVSTPKTAPTINTPIH